MPDLRRDFFEEMEKLASTSPQVRLIVGDLGYSLDGRRIAVRALQGDAAPSDVPTTEIWDAESGQPLLVFRGHSEAGRQPVCLPAPRSEAPVLRAPRSHSRPWGWKFLRISLIIPWAVPTIVNGAMWRWIYSADFGALNGLLMQFGLIDHYVPWLTLPKMAMNLVIAADVWHTMPFVALVLQAALATLPEDLDEAAAVDGANAWQRFWYIRLPMLRPAILVALIVRTVDAFRVFDIVYILTNGGPAYKTLTITFLTYLNSFSFGKQGIGAALSFLISLVTISMAMIYIRFLYRPEESG